MIQICYFQYCSFERHHFEAELRAADVALKKKHTRSGRFEIGPRLMDRILTSLCVMED